MCNSPGSSTGQSNGLLNRRLQVRVLLGAPTVKYYSIVQGLMMGKTTRKQPEWMREDDRWMKKGAKHNGPSRKAEKQDFMREIDDYFDNRR